MGTSRVSPLLPASASFEPSSSTFNVGNIPQHEMEIDDTMGMGSGISDPQASQSLPSMPILQSDISNTQPTPPPAPRETFRDIQVKVHIRRADRDSWVYMGRGVVSQDINGHSSRVVVRAVSTGKVICVFNEGSELQAEKRGNFVVIGCVEGSRVVSWSLNALNNSETLRLLASIELACYKCKQVLADPRHHSKSRRRIERVIKDDRRRRHRRRKDQEAMIDAFSKQSIGAEANAMEAGPPPF